MLFKHQSSTQVNPLFSLFILLGVQEKYYCTCQINWAPDKKYLSSIIYEIRGLRLIQTHIIMILFKNEDFQKRWVIATQSKMIFLVLYSLDNITLLQLMYSQSNIDWFWYDSRKPAFFFTLKHFYEDCV